MKISTPLGNFVLKVGDTMSGNLDMGGNLVTGLGSPASAQDALRKGTRITAAELLDGTSGLPLLGQGAGVSPTYTALGANVASDVIAGAANTERSSGIADGVYRKQKEIQLLSSGSYRVAFDLHSGDSGQTSFGRVYKNGVAVGAERSTTLSTYTTYTEDFAALVSGDLLQLYTKAAATSQVVRNFQVKAAMTPSVTVTLD